MHFRGAYDFRDTLGYRNQIRIVRNDPKIRSVGDACGFAKNGRKLLSRNSGARMFHYGYVRPPKVMHAKDLQFQQFYILDKAGNPLNEIQDVHKVELQDYIYSMRACVEYRGSHPQVMQEKIAAKDWDTPVCDLTPMWRNPKWWQGRLRKAFPFLKRFIPEP